MVTYSQIFDQTQALFLFHYLFVKMVPRMAQDLVKENLRKEELSGCGTSGPSMAAHLFASRYSGVLPMMSDK